MTVVVVDACGEIGLVLDPYSQEILPNAWTRAKNARFREGYAERFFGHTGVYGTPSVPPYFVMNMLHTSGNLWLYAGLQKIYTVDPNNAHTNITRQTASVDVNYTGAASNKWNGGVLSGIPILNNGVDDPQYWPGTGKCAALTAWPANTKCRIMRPFKNYLIALNVTKNTTVYPHLVKWSTAADPGTLPTTWDETDETEEAGEYDLAEDQTELVDGLALGDQFIAYKRGGFYSVQWIGAPFIFRFQRIPGSIGALATNCVSQFVGGHFVLGPGDVFVHQGGAIESVIDARNRRWLFNQMNAANGELAFTAVNPIANEAWICFPQVGDSVCTLALVWNYKYNTWGVRELPGLLHADLGTIDYTAGQTWASIGGSWDSSAISWEQNLSGLGVQNLLLPSITNTKLYAAEYGSSFDSTVFESYVERNNIRFDKPNTVKLVTQVRPIIEGPIGATVNVYLNAAYDQVVSPVTYGPYPFVIGTDQKIDCHVVGRMLGVKFQSQGDFSWRIKRYELEVSEIGMY